MRLTKKSLAVGVLAMALVGSACTSDEEPAPDPTPTPAATTAAPSPTAAPTAAAPSFNPEQQAVADVFHQAFDTEADDASVAAAYAPDPELADILVASAAAAEEQGSATIEIEVIDVVIDGDLATVSFNILIGGNVVTTGTGLGVDVEGEWKVHVSTLCGLLMAGGNPPEGCSRVELPEGAE